MAERAIFKMAVVAILNFKKINGHVTAIGFTISVPNFIEIGQFFTDIWRFNDFENNGRPPPWILKHLQFLSCSRSAFFVQNFAIWNFKKNSFLVA